MSVYTELSQSEIVSILATYKLGALHGFSGITAGIENSNYFIDTDCGRFVMTIFERMNADDLPYFMSLLQHLSAKGFPCPSVLPQNEGTLLFDFQKKKGCIVSCLPGETIEQLSASQLSAASRMLAKLHIAGADFPEPKPNATDLEWVSRIALDLCDSVQLRYGTEASELLVDELKWQRDNSPEELPAGIIHADYFPDNILFSDDRITGVIDFYYACAGFFAYDLAIAINAMAIRLKKDDMERATLMLNAYEQSRTMSDEEKRAFPALLRLAALRFWVSRLYDVIYPRQGSMVQIKDPEEYQKKLLRCRSLARMKTSSPAGVDHLYLCSGTGYERTA